MGLDGKGWARMGCERMGKDGMHVLHDMRVLIKGKSRKVGWESDVTFQPPSPPPPPPPPPLSPPPQFIVVSLKEGMFNNANVVYRTKFVEGVSTVTRTVPPGAAQANRERAARGKAPHSTPSR